MELSKFLAPFRALLEFLVSIYRRAATYVRISGSGAIMRRYFATNAFDGAMTTLGILLGVYLVGYARPEVVVGVVMSTSLALFISGVFSVYVVESAERKRALEELEAAVMLDLDDTLIGEADRFVSLFTALIDGLAPLLVSLISISPFILSSQLSLDPRQAALFSIGTVFLILFLLGSYLGVGSIKRRALSGLKMLAAGIVASICSVVLKAFG